MRNQPLLLLFLLVSVVALSHHVAARKPVMVGGYRPIKDINDLHVKEIGQFAVSEHNKKAGQNLVFVRVVSGDDQVVAGINYRLVVEAKDGAASNKYVTVVWEKAWENFKQLISFQLKA